ncbi:hypothetical protein ElyMa_004915900 [Elysia marginata]|uniref:Uncharacterized protein n=1 Tax=Elysia marginata TaxID=1093978 RepID=A0AAV4IWE5_9GAST|nr:hypothetical protein ElyMa_004915900 [Elysia marginata]
MWIGTDLNLYYSRAVDCMLKEEAWTNFLRKKGVIVIKEAHTFTEAQKSGKISGSFLDWMRTQTGVVGTLFQALQERCLLFDTPGSQDVLNKQRSELVDMIYVRVIGGCYYTDIKFKKCEKKSFEIQTQLSDLKFDIQTQLSDLKLKTSQVEHSEKTNSGKAVERIEEIEKQHSALKEHMKNKNSELEKTEKTHLEEAAKRFQKLEKQLSDLSELMTKNKPELEKTEKTNSGEAAKKLQQIDLQLSDLKEEFTRMQEKTVWRNIKSVFLSYSHSLSSRSVPLLALSMLILVIALFVLPYFLSVPAYNRKEITALDKSQELRRYVEVKFEQTTRRIQDIENQLTGIKIHGHMKKENHEKGNQNDSLNAAKVTQDVLELFTELKEQLLKETAELDDNGERESVVWSMIRSLLVSLSLTLMLLLLVPYRVPAPWHPLLGTVLRELLFLQLMLLLLLSGVYAVWTVFYWI